jgi:hypothetical protein
MPPDRELQARLRLLVAEGLTLDAIASRVGLDRASTCQAIARAGLPIPGNRDGTASGVITDVLWFFELWRDPELTVRDIASALNVTPGAVFRGARRYGLGRRQRMRPDDAEVDPEEDAASCASLNLAPFTASRAAEVRRGWTDHDRRIRVVQKCQPISYGGKYFP